MHTCKYLTEIRLQEINRSEDEDEEQVEVLGEGCMSPEAIAEAERTFEQLYGFGGSSGAPGVCV